MRHGPPLLELRGIHFPTKDGICSPSHQLLAVGGERHAQATRQGLLFLRRRLNIRNIPPLDILRAAANQQALSIRQELNRPDIAQLRGQTGHPPRAVNVRNVPEKNLIRPTARSEQTSVPRDGSGLDRFVVEEAIEFVRHLACADVTLLRLFLQALEVDGFQIARYGGIEQTR